MPGVMPPKLPLPEKIYDRMKLWSAYSSIYEPKRCKFCKEIVTIGLVIHVKECHPDEEVAEETLFNDEWKACLKRAEERRAYIRAAKAAKAAEAAKTD